MLLVYVNARTQDDKGTSRRVGSRRERSGGQSRQGRKRGWGTGGWQAASHSGLLPQPAPLYVTPGHLLDKFIKDCLQPNRTFLDQIKKAVDVICKFLKENCFRHSTTKCQKIVKVSNGLSLCYWRGLSCSCNSAMLVTTGNVRTKDEGGKLGRWAARTLVFSGGC